jgi:hypothetical protein
MSLITLSTTHRSPLSQLHEYQQAITPYLGPGSLRGREETHKRPFHLTFQAAECSPAFKSPLFLSLLQSMQVYSIPSPSQASYNSPNDFLRSKSLIDISCIPSINAFSPPCHWCRQRALCDTDYFPDLRPHWQIPPLLQRDNNFPLQKSWQFILTRHHSRTQSGYLFIPSIAILPTYFTIQKFMARRIAASSGSIAGVIYPEIFYEPHHASVYTVGSCLWTVDC